MGCSKIIGLKSQMEFVVSQIVGLLPIFQPGQLQQMAGLMVSQIHDGEIRGFNPPGFFQAQGFFIESQGSLEVQHIEIVVDEFELHYRFPFSVKMPSSVWK